MVARPVWTIWTMMSAVPQKAVKLNHSLTPIQYLFYLPAVAVSLCTIQRRLRHTSPNVLQPVGFSMFTSIGPQASLMPTSYLARLGPDWSINDGDICGWFGCRITQCVWLQTPHGVWFLALMQLPIWWPRRWKRLILKFEEVIEVFIPVLTCDIKSWEKGSFILQHDNISFNIGGGFLWWLYRYTLFLGIGSEIAFTWLVSLSCMDSMYCSWPHACIVATQSAEDLSIISLVCGHMRSLLSSSNGFPRSFIKCASSSGIQVFVLDDWSHLRCCWLCTHDVTHRVHRWLSARLQ